MPTKMKPLKLEQDDQQITVSGDGFAVAFDKAEGTISQLERDGVNLLAAGGGPKLHLWRAPHRNDDMWAYDDWTKCGLTDLKRKVDPHPRRAGRAGRRARRSGRQGRGQARLQRDCTRPCTPFTATARSRSTTP